MSAEGLAATTKAPRLGDRREPRAAARDRGGPGTAGRSRSGRSVAQGRAAEQKGHGPGCGGRCRGGRREGHRGHCRQSLVPGPPGRHPSPGSCRVRPRCAAPGARVPGGTAARPHCVSAPAAHLQPLPPREALRPPSALRRPAAGWGRRDTTRGPPGTRQHPTASAPALRTGRRAAHPQGPGGPEAGASGTHTTRGPHPCPQRRGEPREGGSHPGDPSRAPRGRTLQSKATPGLVKKVPGVTALGTALGTPGASLHVTPRAAPSAGAASGPRPFHLRRLSAASSAPTAGPGTAGPSCPAAWTRRRPSHRTGARAHAHSAARPTPGHCPRASLPKPPARAPRPPQLSGSPWLRPSPGGRGDHWPSAFLNLACLGLRGPS